MITRTGIGTLAAGGGIVAAVVCVLVGVQLLLLGAEIGSLVPLTADSGAGGLPAAAWQALIRASAWLSLLAGGLVLLLVWAHRRGWSHAGTDSGRRGADALVEDVTVRIYDLDAAGDPVEISPRSAGSPRHVDQPLTTKTGLDSAEDESRDILAGIDEVTRDPQTAPRPSWRGFLRRFLRGPDRS
jgi:hypothetical protein